VVCNLRPVIPMYFITNELPMDLVGPYSYFQVTKEFHLEFETFFVNFLSLKEIIFINFFFSVRAKRLSLAAKLRSLTKKSS